VSDQRADRLKSTPEREDPSDWLWPHENDADEWETRYGAGISLTRCPKARVEECRARRSQNGLLLTRCDQATVTGCDFSFLSGWGIAMYRSSGGWIAGNVCDFCVRGYSHGVYARGQDSAGILVFEQCSKNSIFENLARHSGDGLFLYAGNETVKRTGKGGCNDNDVRGNDFSCAVANGIEATFSEGNRFVANRLEACDHGVWAGYSRRSEIAGNSILRCANGVSIEHGDQNSIVGNSIEDCGTGVHLWWDSDPDLAATAYGAAHASESHANVVRGNRIVDAKTAIRLVDDQCSRVERNEVLRARLGLDVAGDATGLVVADNRIEADVTLRCATNDPLTVAHAVTTPWRVEGPQSVARRDGKPLIGGTLETPGVPPRFGRRGRERIVVGEWGPLDPSQPALVRAGPSSFHVLGDDARFEVLSLSEGFVAEPKAGTPPATIRIGRTPATGASSLAPYSLRVRVSDRTFEESGTLLSAAWKVRWFAWAKDPREDAAAWAGLVAGKPLVEAELPALDFATGGSPHEGVPADKFATVAETTLVLPAGRYRLDTVSDDGIRVLVDGKVVLEDWTWHGPTPHAVDLDLAAGAHSMRVEHFELDGYAALRVTVKPAIDR